MCPWACNRGELRGVAKAATLGCGATLGGGTNLGGGVTIGGGVDVSGERGGNTRGVFCCCGGACGTRPSGVVGEDWGIKNVFGGASICGMRFFEDGVKAFKVAEAGGADMVRHAAFDIVG